MTRSFHYRVAALLFDMDGTLVDSTAVVERAWTLWAGRHGVPVADVLRFSHGRPSIDTMERFRPGRDHARDQAEMKRFEESELAGLRAVPGAEAVVRAAMKGRWAVVTSAWRALAVARLTAANLPVPDVLFPADEIRNFKPHPEGYLRAAELLGVASKDCLVFEDARPGIDAGLAAGMRVVALRTTHADLAHELQIRDLRDVEVSAGFDVRLRLC